MKQDNPLNPSPRVRNTIYVLVTLGTALVVPLHQFEVASDLVLALWTSLSGAATLLASLNTPRG